MPEGRCFGRGGQGIPLDGAETLQARGDKGAIGQDTYI